MENATVTFRSETLVAFATFLADKPDFADLYSLVKAKSEAATILATPGLPGTPGVPITITFPGERATALFELIEDTLAGLSAVPEQSDVWRVLKQALKT